MKGTCLEFTKWSMCIYFLFNILLFLFYVYEYFASMYVSTQYTFLLLVVAIR